MIINERGNTACNITNQGLAAIQGDWVYYRNNGGGRLYKIRTDESGKAKLNDEDSNFIIIRFPSAAAIHQEFLEGQ